MSEKALYHALGLRGYDVENVQSSEDGLIVTISQLREKLRCACCGSSRVHVHDSRVREFRTVPIGMTKTWIKYDVPRVRCRSCNQIRQVKVSFAEGQRRYTKVFERMIREISRFMTPTDVSRYLDISWDMARDIQARDLKRKYGRPKLRNLKVIAIENGQ